MRGSLLDRFEAKYCPVPETGCWIWTAVTSNGYGRIHVAGKHRSAHRISYELYNGPIPTHDSYHGMCVCHSCDVSLCVNPEHLFLGTNRDNLADMARKGRSPKGVKNVHAKLNEANVRDIRILLAKGACQKDITKAFGIGPSAISKIKLRRAWSHVL